MTHHPNTPASRNEAAATSTTLLDIHRALGAYGNARACSAMDSATLKAEVMCLVEAAIASRTEQAAPSVASGVADDAALLAWGERHRIGADVKRLRWAYEDAISLAAPGAAPVEQAKAAAMLEPTITLGYVPDEHGTFRATMTISGLPTEEKAQAALDHMEHLFCGPELENLND